jgi:hypothetical protein
VTQCKEKLASFESLIEVEEEPLETIRDVANADLDELVSALATEDIVPERVDLAFAKLGIEAATLPATVFGDLKLVRDRYGLLLDNVRTVKDEALVTEFALMIDLLASLRRTWETNREFFTLRGKEALSRKIWLLERWQGIALERMEVVNTVLEQAGLDPASVELGLTYGDPVTGRQRKTRMFFSDLMSWTEDVLQQGLGMPADADEIGRDEAISFAHTIKEVGALVASAAADTADVRIGGVGVPSAYRWNRVKVALADLANSLKVIGDEVAAIARPPFTVDAARLEFLEEIVWPVKNRVELITKVTVIGNRLPDQSKVTLTVKRPGGDVSSDVLILVPDRRLIVGISQMKLDGTETDVVVTVTDPLGESLSTKASIVS